MKKLVGGILFAIIFSFLISIPVKNAKPLAASKRTERLIIPCHGTR